MHVQRLTLGLALLALSDVGLAQAPVQTATSPASSTNETTVASVNTPSIARSLSVIVYPAKNQTPHQQGIDETECYNWAKSNTGIDPQAPPAAAPPAEEKKPRGERVKSAARGAAAGAVIGEVANDDASQGAKVGATAGVIAGGQRSRAQQRAASESANANQQAAHEQQLATFRKAFGTCLTGKGYSTG